MLRVEKRNEKLKKKLDMNIPTNRMVLEYVNVGADMGIEKVIMKNIL